MSERIEVVRAFYFEGAPRPAGEVLVVSDGFAAELISLGKARLAPPPADPPRRRSRRSKAASTVPDLEN